MSNLISTTNTTLVNQDAITRFTSEQIDLIKGTVTNGTTDDELKLFLYMATRTGLDPFARQIYAIKRKGKMTIQIGIDGYRVIADRTGRYAPGREPAFSYDDESKLKSATAYVKKLVGNTWHEVAATAHWDEFYPGDGEIGFMWRRMPHTLLAKVAECQALRRAFPAELSGLYSNEEMAQADPDAEEQNCIQEANPIKSTQFNNGQLLSPAEVKVSAVSPSVSENPNRELLKRVGKLTGHSNKEIAATLETNFPGLKSNQLGESEIKAIVDVLCVDVAVRNGMNSIQARTTFNEWLGQQPQDLGNEELARHWMNEIKAPAF
ncbi:MAG: phage recombination protein Bet [Chroococcidiopsidaceae cyanobacterium CP_BM_RX_35]|nr:phage recombination protein Bet [Chroococcidiopsidaceae cyanobacterium CP_BM_RX_35]